MAEEKERKAQPTIMYREGESKLFNHPDDVPKGEGWVDHPDKVKSGKSSGAGSGSIGHKHHS